MAFRTYRLIRRFILTLPLAAAAAMTFAGSSSAIRIEIDDVAPDRVERQRAFAEGALPLSGTPDLGQLNERIAAQGLKLGSQMFIRVFKAESELEVWLRKGERFVLFATYPICHWAGTIGPKLREGDRQNPEGFYSVGARQLHRIGRWPRSLNLGFPNSFDRAHGRTGSYILVHGGCSSVGCFAMTNAVMSEIFAIAEQALKGGQPRVDVHVFPFRMTDANLANHATSPWLDFWRNLKEGYDAFETSKLPPKVGLCDRRYVIETTAPGEVGTEGPLALCGALRAALVEPNSQSLAGLPSNWLQQQTPYQQAESHNLETQGERQIWLPPSPPRSAFSGAVLPPQDQPAFLAKLSLWQQGPLPRSRPRPGGARQQAAAPPLCNQGLTSCRKFLAMRSRNSSGSMLAIRSIPRSPVVTTARLTTTAIRKAARPHDGSR